MATIKREKHTIFLKILNRNRTTGSDISKRQALTIEILNRNRTTAGTSAKRQALTIEILNRNRTTAGISAKRQALTIAPCLSLTGQERDAGATRSPQGRCAAVAT